MNTSEPALARQLKTMEEVKADWRPLQLSHIHAQEFARVIGPLVGLNLNAKFHPDLNLVKVATDWYALTKGNWWLLKGLAKSLDDELGSIGAQEPRVITEVVLERVYGRFT